MRPSSMLLVAAALVAMATHRAAAVAFNNRCQLARELVRNYVPRNQIPDWICLLQVETYNMETNTISDNQEYGMFQISSQYWCAHGKRGGGCNMRCEDLLNGDLSDDIACAKIIHNESGFSAWGGWSSACKGRALMPRCLY